MYGVHLELSYKKTVLESMQVLLLTFLTIKSKCLTTAHLKHACTLHMAYNKHSMHRAQRSPPFTVEHTQQMHTHKHTHVHV